ncbi:MAG: kelch repeat-containing protein [Polyangiales bacterium]
MERVSRRFLGIVAAGALLGCRTPTQITIEVTTEIACDPKTKATTSIAVGSLGEALEGKPPVVFTGECRQVNATTWRIGSLVVVPSGDSSAEVAIRVVTGINKDPRDCEQDPKTKVWPKDCIIARRALRFVPHTELYLPVGMDLDCTNVPCGSTTTCVSGRCVSATIEDSSRCTTPEACDESALPQPAGGGDAGVDGGSDGAPDADVDATDSGDAGPPSGWAKIADAARGRLHHGAVWTGTEMIVFGGQLSASSGYTNTGERYDPVTNKWRAIADSPLTGRRYFAMHWTGDEVLVWGGEGGLTDGARYDPVTDKWRLLPTTTLASRDDFVSIYAPSLSAMLIWGGDVGAGPLSDGQSFSTVTDTWTALGNPTPAGVRGRSESSGVWDGARMYVYGGFCPAFCNDTASYDPATKAWSLLGPTTADKRGDVFGLLLGTSKTPIPTFFGGGQFSAFEGHTDGAWWDGAKWMAIPEPPTTTLPDPTRVWPAVWAANDRVYAWGGFSTGKLHADGAVFDRATGTWSAMPPSPLPARSRASVVWTGKQAIVFGGNSELPGPVETELADGAIFTP